VETLSAVDAKTTDTRTAYAVRLHKQLRRRSEEIQAGAQPHKAADLPLSDAVDWYFEAHPHLRERTLDGYRDACAVFLAWAKQTNVGSVRQLSRGDLVRFKTSRVKAPKVTQQGAKLARSGFTINKELTYVGIVLGWLIDSEVMRLTRDDVRIGLKKIETEKVTKRDFLKPEQIEALLMAAKRHDGLRYKATRDEHARGIGGQTARYSPVADFIRFLLLTGCRFGEALAITWDNVDFAAGRLDFHSHQTKTKTDRTVELDVCPSLITMLKEMRKRAKLHERVWQIHTPGSLASTRKRMRRDPLCPWWDYQLFRVTAATYLACMPSYGPVLKRGSWAIRSSSQSAITSVACA
jgi:integrase